MKDSSYSQVLTLSAKCQNSNIYKMDYISNEFHEEQTISMSVNINILRLGHTNLKTDLVHKKIIENPMCICELNHETQSNSTMKFFSMYSTANCMIHTENPS